MIPAIVVFLYLATVLYIGIFAFRHAKGKEEAEDYFLASRSLGPFVFLFSLFGTNMTAFAILGSSGHAFNNGIVTFDTAATRWISDPAGIGFVGSSSSTWNSPIGSHNGSSVTNTTVPR